MTNITPEAFCNDIAAQIAARRRQMQAAIVTRRQDQAADSSGHQERRSREDALRQRAEYLKSLAQELSDQAAELPNSQRARLETIELYPTTPDDRPAHIQPKVPGSPLADATGVLVEHLTMSRAREMGRRHEQKRATHAKTGTYIEGWVLLAPTRPPQTRAAAAHPYNHGLALLPSGDIVVYSTELLSAKRTPIAVNSPRKVLLSAEAADIDCEIVQTRGANPATDTLGGVLTERFNLDGYLTATHARPRMPEQNVATNLAAIQDSLVNFAAQIAEITS